MPRFKKNLTAINPVFSTYMYTNAKLPDLVWQCNSIPVDEYNDNGLLENLTKEKFGQVQGTYIIRYKPNRFFDACLATQFVLKRILDLAYLDGKTDKYKSMYFNDMHELSQNKEIISSLRCIAIADIGSMTGNRDLIRLFEHVVVSRYFNQHKVTVFTCCVPVDKYLTRLGVRDEIVYQLKQINRGIDLL